MGGLVFLGWDSASPRLVRELMADGRLPVLAGLVERHGWFDLDDVDVKAGLAWEHFHTGAPEGGNTRSSAVEFDPDTYAVYQRGARHVPPWFASVSERVLAFDLPFIHPATLGDAVVVTDWGSHDPAFPPSSTPPELLGQIVERFGRGAPEHYQSTWHSLEAQAAFIDELVVAEHRRAEVVTWLMARHPERDVVLTAFPGAHSGGEQLFHGIDPAHPLHDTPGGRAARDGLIRLYEAMDAATGLILDAVPPDAAVVIASPQGMEVNVSDVCSLLTLPELLHRHEHGEPFLRTDRSHTGRPSATDRWGAYIGSTLRPAPSASTFESFAGRVRRLARKARIGADRTEPRRAFDDGSDEMVLELGHQPTTWFAEQWQSQRAFALPTFTDGRIRINLRGREAHGVVDVADYHAVCDELVDLLSALCDEAGAPAVRGVRRPVADDPMAADRTQADLIVTWASASDRFTHPTLGSFGPYPWKRTGEHAGDGFAVVVPGRGGPADVGQRSARDLAPTLAALAGAPPGAVSGGRSLLEV